MNGKTISVIVPAYNIAPWISRSLDSLLAQTHKDLEIIVVDDGSKDHIREVLEGYCEKYPNIRAIYKENGGVTSARLRGVAEATGDWIGFMDGDGLVAFDNVKLDIPQATEAEKAELLQLLKAGVFM